MGSSDGVPVEVLLNLATEMDINLNFMEGLAPMQSLYLMQRFTMHSLLLWVVEVIRGI